LSVEKLNNRVESTRYKSWATKKITLVDGYYDALSVDLHGF
jgi:hypothetical protein